MGTERYNTLGVVDRICTWPTRLRTFCGFQDRFRVRLEPVLIYQSKCHSQVADYYDLSALHQEQEQNVEKLVFGMKNQMALISLSLKGPKEVFEIEFSRLFALRYAVHIIRVVQNLLLRSKCLRNIAIALFTVFVIVFFLFPGQERYQGVPDAGECYGKVSVIKSPSHHILSSD